jgi:phosphomannomutase/phosphoglucomutase
VSIYKPCDIRGPGAKLTPELYRCWGQALGTQIEPRAKFVVGGDVRASTPQFLAALAEGLAAAGASVVDVGQLPTPMVYYAKRRLQAAGCAVVTASHNPADQNGLKWMIGSLPPSAADVARLRTAAEQGRAGGPVEPKTPEPFSPRALDVTFDYVAWLQETWVDSLEAELHVVLDPRHGCNAARARRYLQAVFPRCLFSALHDTVESNFGGLSPDCTKAEALAELSTAVEHARADLGIAFDGDGDRVAFVDGDGLHLTAEEATCVLLESFGAEATGQTFVHDVKFSDRVVETARRLGTKTLAERSGHAFIRRRMRETQALFGAEISGHYFYRCLEGGDDGLFTACWMIAWLAQSGRSLAQQRRDCPRVFITPDLRVPLDPACHGELIGRVRAAWSGCQQSTLDGVRIDFPEGWALVRSSVTEAGLTFRFESTGWRPLEQLVWRFCAPLGKVGEQLWAAYGQAMGTHCDLSE